MNHALLRCLHNCRFLRSLKCIHACLVIDGSTTSSDLVLNKILRVYSRFGAIDCARKVFEEITQPNAFLWTALIHGHVENQQYAEAFALFCRMRTESVPPLNFTISSVLKALARQTRVKDGEAVYGFSLKYGLGFDVIVQNAVLELLMRCQKVDVAIGVFDEMQDKDIVSWNSMISGCGNNGRVEMARELFNKMPDRNVVSWTSLICGYVKADDMAEARNLFYAMPVKDLASWKVMLSGYMDTGDLISACCVFEAMPIHDIVTWNIMISGFCKAGELGSARDIFNKMLKRNVVSWTMMIDGYIKAGDINEAKCLFDQMPERNLVSWSTMIGGFAKNRQPHCALEMFGRFKEEGIKPDETFILEIISACSQLGILDTAEAIMRDCMGPHLFSNQRIVTSLVDMYAKCGSIEKALQVFEKAYPKDLLCYSTMIGAFANHGLGPEALSLFNELLRASIKPDGVTFLSVLSACNHGGLADEGRRYFKQMTGVFGIQPSEKHFACMVDLLGRSGSLDEAHKLIINMPLTPTSVVWGALLAACRVHCNVPIAEVAAAELFKIEPENSGNYILLSNIYAAAGMWSDVGKVRAMIREHGVRKNRGSSWIELGRSIHEFVTGDVSHLYSSSIYLILDLLYEDMRLSGCMVDSKQKELITLSTSWSSYIYPYEILEGG
ncbi:pentatricopeptide repeat-containing protein At4g02750-like [Malania oleifera]|uniref:pentatricopeptide repeat-containing protein At4g02750-like n=1 Tax=Malania oleifera TaxID=397392 RepID=UPI0025ADDFCB|nr:pentatricopeptide repeat-containing protein At4g02750-like [Malania oleifera]